MMNSTSRVVKPTSRSRPTNPIMPMAVMSLKNQPNVVRRVFYRCRQASSHEIG